MRGGSGAGTLRLEQLQDAACRKFCEHLATLEEAGVRELVERGAALAALGLGLSELGAQLGGVAAGGVERGAQLDRVRAGGVDRPPARLELALERDDLVVGKLGAL